MTPPGAASATTHPRFIHTYWPWVGLVVGSLLTLLLWFQIRRVEQDRLRSLQVAQTGEMVLRLQGEMKALEKVLLGVANYAGQGTIPTRAEWHSYVEELQLSGTFPGLQGFAFVEWIPRKGLDAHIQRIQKEGFPDYTVLPGGTLPPDPEGYSSIIYLEPMDARNQRAIAHDMLRDAARRAAMVRARDTGLVTLTAPITLYQEMGTEVQSGTLMMVPIYRQGLPRDTVTQRRQALRGWSSFVFRMGDFTRAALGRDLADMDLELSDGDGSAPSQHLFASNPARPGPRPTGLIEQAFEVAGRTWTIRTLPTDRFLVTTGFRTQWEILLSGLGMSLFVFTLLITFQGAEARANLLAKQRGEELLATESKFRALFEKAPVGMAILDLTTSRFLSVNPGLTDLLGYSEAELLGRTYRDVTVPEDIGIGSGAIQALTTGGADRFHLEKRYRRKDGTVLHGRLHVVRLPGTPEAGPRSFAILEDISDRSRLEEVLRASEARFRAYFEKNLAVNLIIDPADGRIVGANPAAERFYGWTGAELLLKKIQDINTATAEELLAETARARSEQQQFFQFTHRLASGDERQVEVYSSPMDWNGRQLLFSIVHDVSGRVEAEKALAESEGRWQFALEGAGDGVWDCDEATDSMFLSRVYKTMLGYGPDEALASSTADWIERIHPEDRDPVQDALAAYFEGAAPIYQTEYRIRRKDGSYIWVLARGMAVAWDSRKRPTRMIGTHADITERKRVEEALRMSEQRLRVLGDQLPDSFLYQYVTGPGRPPRFLYLSSGVERLCGVGVEEVLRDASVLLGQIDPAMLSAYLEQEAASTRDQIPFKMDLRQQRPDGSWRWFRVRSIPRPQVDGAIVWEGISTDVTEQKLAQVALEESESRFRNMADSAPALIWMSGLDQRCFWFNQVWLDWTGRTMEQERGNGWAEGVHPEDLPQCLKTYVSSFEARQPFEMEYRLRHRSGDYRWVLDRGAPRSSAEGTFLGYIGACTDIQDQKEAVAAVQESEARFRSVVEGSPMPLFLHRDGRFIYVNSPGLRLLGAKAPEDLIGQPILDRVHPDSRELVLRRLADALTHGVANMGVEERFLSLDGTVIEVEVQGRPILYGGQQTVLAFAQDITERKQALAALQESESRFRTLADTAPVLIWMTGLDKRCTHVNQGWMAWTGRTLEQALGLGWTEGMHPDDLPACRATYERCFDAREPFAMEFRLRHRDGTYRWISDRGAPRFAEDGTFLGYIGAGNDIQDARDAEASIRAGEVRARKAESLVLMAGGIAHDFNNLFQALQGNLEMAELQARRDPAILQPLERAKEALHRAVTLSWKMLDFSGHFFLTMKPLDLAGWLQEALPKLQAGLPAGLQLDLTWEPVPFIQVDEAKLEQVLQALVDNASEAAEGQGGRIQVRLFTDFGMDRSGAESPGIWPLDRPDLPATVCLELRDEGPGVPAEKMNLICDPFYTTRHPGRGLGLPATVGILNAHRAGLHILNGPEKGLILRLHFPPLGV